MLESILGNKSATKVMHYLYKNGEVHASQIANHYHTALDPIKKQLEKFHKKNILESRIVGRMRLYRFNKTHPFHNALMELVNISLKYSEINNKNNSSKKFEEEKTMSVYEQ